MRPAIILLSGGLDSATVLAIARSQRFELHALSFRYGQRHQHELACATRIAAAARVKRHVIAEIDLRIFGGSALTADIDVPKLIPSNAATTNAPQIPITYVPARNTIFLSFALAMAETTAASDIFIGVNAVDYSGYPDCRPEYLHAYELMANLATRAGVEGAKLHLHAPLINLSKADIIRKGVDLGVDFSLTSSCYDPHPSGLACGTCDACQIRRRGFAEANLPDPTQYALR